MAYSAIDLWVVKYLLIWLTALLFSDLHGSMGARPLGKMVVVLNDKRIGKLSSRCRQVEDREVERRSPCWEEMRDFLMTRALGLPQISTDIRPYQCST